MSINDVQLPPEGGSHEGMNSQALNAYATWARAYTGWGYMGLGVHGLGVHGLRVHAPAGYAGLHGPALHEPAEGLRWTGLRSTSVRCTRHAVSQLDASPVEPRINGTCPRERTCEETGPDHQRDTQRHLRDHERLSECRATDAMRVLERGQRLGLRRVLSGCESGTQCGQQRKTHGECDDGAAKRG